ncbi:MAG: hypothetical protein K5744_04515 [Eubacterium sp.]|nr:hypothetical protein [Eubacterium sp.]
MEERKIGRIIILVAFAVIICGSRGIWFFSEKYVDATNYENRRMATRPELTLDTYENFSKEYTSYFNDNLQFRNNLITMNSAIDYFGFGRASNGSVIVGKDRWLFYDNAADGDPVSCYQGTNLYTEEELKAVAANCMKQRDFVESRGKEFMIFLAPNKERIYAEYMPERYGRPAENYGILQLYTYLKEHTDLRVVYPYEELMQAKEKLKQNIYYHTDTHWNFLGGYVGAKALMKELGVEIPGITDKGMTIRDEGRFSGDLANMLNLNKQLQSADRSYMVAGYDTHDSTCTDDDMLKMWSFTAKNADPRSIYVIRDSFTSQMAAYIGSQFDHTYLRHYESYDYEDLKKCDPDIVVYECVERQAARLGTFSIEHDKPDKSGK